MLGIKDRVWSALPAALLLIGISAMGMTGAAAQGTPEARQACTPDAMRLCSEFVSDATILDELRQPNSTLTRAVLAMPQYQIS